MFSIFKKSKSTKVDLSILGTDMHSHLLPGIDDGSEDTDMSLQLIAALQDLGYKQFITTPHIYWDLYKNNATTINSAHARLQQGLLQQENRVPVRPAAEYFLDDHFDHLLHTNTPLLTIFDNYVLVEFSFVSPPLNFKEKLFNMQMKGYQPILAHPERYLYARSNKEWFDELKNAGCVLQLNILSLTGYYGKGSQQLAQYLIDKNYISLIGTDCHHFRHIAALRAGGAAIMQPLQAMLDAGLLLNTRL
jgi:Capsular polysaccharide biosynthesis protein